MASVLIATSLSLFAAVLRAVSKYVEFSAVRFKSSRDLNVNMCLDVIEVNMC